MRWLLLIWLSTTLPMIAMMMNVAQLPVTMPMTMAAGQMTPLATASQSVLPVVPGGAESGRGAGVLAYVGAHVAGCAYGWSGEPGCGAGRSANRGWKSAAMRADRAAERRSSNSPASRRPAS